MKRGILWVMTENKKKVVVLAVAGLLFSGGVAAGYIFFGSARSLQASTFFEDVGPLRSQNVQFDLVHPLIAYETPEAIPLEEYASLKSKLRGMIDHATSTKVASDVSMYYRDLETGRWIAINRGSTYYPASLLKVPVMIAYFRQAESDPSLFDKRIVYSTLSSGNTFEAPSELTVGHSYSIRELIEHMIVDSDNGATYTLLSRVNEALLSEVYTDLGIQDPGDDSSNYEISTKTYALFFRILYNATYLTPKDSEEALQLLVRTTYNDGIVSGLPAGVPVAHKYGEHIVNEGTAVAAVELHDCGIVYRPEHPYILCVMTRAKDLPSASELISSISKVVYEAADVH